MLQTFLFAKCLERSFRRDFSDPASSQSLQLLGVISAHSRPVQCLAVDVKNENSMTLYTADSMGVIKVWDVHRQTSGTSSVRATELRQLNNHRTGVNDMWFHKQILFTGT